MTPLRLVMAEIAARRLVAKGHLSPRSLDYLPRPQCGSGSPAVSGPGRAVTNIAAAVEAAHDVCVGPLSPTAHAPGGPPAPGVVRDPAI